MKPMTNAEVMAEVTDSEIEQLKARSAWLNAKVNQITVDMETILADDRTRRDFTRLNQELHRAELDLADTDELIVAWCDEAREELAANPAVEVICPECKRIRPDGQDSGAHLVPGTWILCPGAAVLS